MKLLSVQHILQVDASRSPVAFDEQQQFSQADFLSAIASLAHHLHSQTTQRWWLVCGNTYQFAIGLFALLAAGKQVLLPPNAQAGTLANLLLPSDALLTQESIADHCKPGESRQCFALPTLDLDALSITLMTSGSTGTPVPIEKSLRCLDEEIRVLESMWGNKLGDAVILATVSHQHIYGLLFRLLWPLCAGRPFAAYTHHLPEPLMADVALHPRTVLVSTPTQLKRLPPSLNLAEARRHLFAVFSSGGLLPMAAAEDLQIRLGEAPIEVLGSTETGGVAWRRQTVSNSLWQPLPTVKINTDDDGKLLVQSSFTGKDFSLAMGDRALLHANGHFELLGRADRVVKVEGKRLSLNEMENQLCHSPLVKEAHALILPNFKERLGCVATLTEQGLLVLEREGKPALTQQLREHLKQRFEDVLLPRKWRFPDDLPTDSQGKTTQTLLKQLFDNRQVLATELIEKTANSQLLRMTLPAGSTLFDGHFPSLPILPGVTQLDLAIRHSAAWYPPDRFKRVSRLKFQEPVVPDDIITLTLQDLGQGQVQFSYTLDGMPLSSGRIHFAE